jgi:hypothetical protein
MPAVLCAVRTLPDQQNGTGTKMALRLFLACRLQSVEQARETVAQLTVKRSRVSAV